MELEMIVFVICNCEDHGTIFDPIQWLKFGSVQNIATYPSPLSPKLVVNQICIVNPSLYDENIPIWLLIAS
jgi:hypothetical protein